MADQQDDRISHFIDAGGLVGDQKFILEILDTVYNKIVQVNSLKVNIFNSTNLAGTLAALKQLQTELNGITVITQKLNTVTEEELKKNLLLAKIRVQNADASQKETKAKLNELSADEKRIAIKQRELDIQQKLNREQTKKTAEKTPTLSKEELNRQAVIGLTKDINYLREAIDRGKRAQKEAAAQYGRDSQQFAKQSHELDILTAKLKQKEAALRRVSEAEKVRQNIYKQAGKAEQDFDDEVEAAKKAGSAYEELKKQIKTLQDEIDELGAREIINPGSLSDDEKKRYAELTVEVQKLTAAKQKLDTESGKASKSASNYAQQLFSLQQILRELPAFAYGVSTGISALSNNIPIFADDIQRLRERNEKLKASGLSTVPVWQQVKEKIFSWQTAIVLGTTAIALLGTKISDWIGKMNVAGKGLDDIKTKIASVNKETERWKTVLELVNNELDFTNSLADKKIDFANVDTQNITKLSNELKGLNTQMETQQVISRQLFSAWSDADIAQLEARNDLLNAMRDEGTVMGDFLRQFTGAESPAEKLNNAFKKGALESFVNDLGGEKTKAAFDQYNKKVKEATDALLKSKGAAQKVDLLNADSITKDLEITKEFARIKRAIALETAKVEVEAIRTKNNDILADEESTERERLAAIERLRKARIAEAQAQLVAVETDPSANDDEIFAARANLQREILAADTESNRQRINTQFQFLIKRKSAETQALVSEKELIARYNEEISGNIEQTYADRLAAAQKAFQQRKEIIDAEYKLQLQQAGLSDKEIVEFEKDRNKLFRAREVNEQLRAIQVDHDNKIRGITIDSGNRQSEIIQQELQKQEKLFDDHLSGIALMYDDLSLASLNNYHIEETALKESLDAKLISYREYIKQRTALERKFQADSLQSDRQEIERKLSTLPFANADKNLEAASTNLQLTEDALAAAPDDESKQRLGADVAVARAQFEIAKKHVEDRNALLRELFGIQQQEKDTVNEIAQENFEKTKQLYDQIFTLVNDAEAFGEALANRALTLRQQQIDQEIELLNKRSQVERESIEQSVLNEEERARRLGELKVRDAAQKDAIDKRQRKLDYDRAKAERTAALSRIAIGLTETLLNLKLTIARFAPLPPPFNAPAVAALTQIPFAIGSAGLAAATILAQPLPRLALGTKDFEGGNVVMGDAWKKELVVEPDGSMWETAAVPTVYNIPKHSVVYPDAEEALEMQMAFAKQTGDDAIASTENIRITVGGIDQLGHKLDKGFKSVVNEIKNKPNPQPQKFSNSALLMKYGANWYNHL